MSEYKLEPLRGRSLIVAAVVGAVLITLLALARQAVGAVRWSFPFDVAIGTIAIVLPIFLVIGLWRRGYVSLAHHLSDGSGEITFVSVRTQRLVDALRSINGTAGAVPGLFVVSVSSESVRLLVPRSPDAMCLLSLPTWRVRKVTAGRVSEGTRMSNGIVLEVTGEPEGLSLPLIATGAGLGGALELPAASVDALRSAIELKISARS